MGPPLPGKDERPQGRAGDNGPELEALGRTVAFLRDIENRVREERQECEAKIRKLSKKAK